jgi:hypothetical protein
VTRIAALAGICLTCSSLAAHADESGASVWLPGQFASFAAVPDDPGFGFEVMYYQRGATAGASRRFPIGANLTAGYDISEQYIFLTPSYVFAEPVLHGQLSVGVTFTAARVDTSVSAVLTGPRGNALPATNSDSMTGVGDLYPIASLKWAVGEHNFMGYTMLSAPTGQYDPNRLAGLGLGHWAIDGGLAYTWLGTSGFEFSVTAGITYNFMNPYTQYQSGVDGHIDLAASYSPTESLYFGPVAYFYNQLGPDSGPGASLGDFKSKVSAAGAQVGYALVIGKTSIDLGFRAYKEFDAQNRPEGWNFYFTVSLSRLRQGPMR